jgi:formamidopyrimidine-DNA glycosylase
MPELPDLQVFAKNLTKQLAGQRLKKLVISKNAKFFSAATHIKKLLEKKKLVKVYREGKELRFAFEGKHILGMHLMLRGKLYWAEDNNTHKSTLAEFYFGDAGLILTDPQRMANITLQPPPAKAPDALSKEINSRFLKAHLQSRATIKNILLDQHIIRGIGNAYADEILWKARISPFSIAAKIPAAAITSLAKAIPSVLKNAEKQVNKAAPGIIGGEVRDFLVIHNARNKKSPAGKPIKWKAAGGRKTYYTAEQKLYT